jgi:hypothetical protein
MTMLRFADASTVWAIEIAQIVLLIFGCAAAGWVVGFAMGYRRGATEAVSGRALNADHRVAGDWERGHR